MYLIVKISCNGSLVSKIEFAPDHQGAVAAARDMVLAELEGRVICVDEERKHYTEKKLVEDGFYAVTANGDLDCFGRCDICEGCPDDINVQIIDCSRLRGVVPLILKKEADKEKLEVLCSLL